MDELGLRRYCCRRMVFTHVDLITKLVDYNSKWPTARWLLLFPAVVRCRLLTRSFFFLFYLWYSQLCPRAARLADKTTAPENDNARN